MPDSTFQPRMITLAFLAALVTAPPPATSPSIDTLRVPILVWHAITPHKPGESRSRQAFDVSPESFAEQMAYLHGRGIPVVSLSALMDALQGKRTLPPRAVVLTFDDGWENQYVHAYPLLKQYGYTATFFVFTHAMNRNDRYFTWGQLREMQAAGMTIGSHTITHPFLSRVKDTLQLRKEIDGSKAELEKQLGTTCEFFAYPFGVVTPAAIADVEAAGYRAARGFPGGVTNSPGNRWVLRSMAVTDDMARFRRIVDPQRVVAKRRETRPR